MFEKLKSNSFQEKLGGISAKMNSNIFIISIRDAMLAYMPFTVIASFFMIVAYFPIPQVTDFITNILGVSDAAVWQDKLMYVNSATLSVGGLYVIISLSKTIAEYKETNVTQAILTAVSAFLLLTPQNILEEGAFLEVTRLGVQAIFTAIIVGILATLLYAKIDSMGIKIKMPESVPPAVSGPFESILPMFVVITATLVIRLLLELVLHTDAMALINTIVGKPLAGVGGSLFGMIIARTASNFFWFFGLHGDSIVTSVLGPLWQMLEDQNRVASLAGLTPPNIICESFRAHFVGIGWIGASIGMLLFAKSKQYKEVGRISTVPHFFNIGEPTVFGVPLMLNFDYIVPILFSNIISTVVSYFAFYFGLVPRITGLAMMPWTTPPIISGYLVTGSVRGAILQIVCLVLATLCWLPFIKASDKKLYAQELAEADSEAIADISLSTRIEG